MADQKKSPQNNPDRQSQQDDETLGTETTRPNREGSQTATGTERQAQPGRSDQSPDVDRQGEDVDGSQQRQSENVETGETGTRRTEEGI